MPKEMVWRYTCSFCGAEGFDPLAFRSFTLAAADGLKVAELPKPVGFDACGDCMEADPMAQLLKVGYPLAKAKAPKTKTAAEEAAPEPAGAYVCKLCGHTSGAPQGLSAHQRWCGKSEAQIAALKAQARAARAANRRAKAEAT